MAERPQASWLTFEQVATHLLTEFSSHFGIEHVEGKQVVRGTSGAHWEIDAKAARAGGGTAFLVVECRRRGRPANQEAMAAIAYRIQDLGAAGGILVTPVDPQHGAKEVAKHANIQCVTLSPSATNTDYVMGLLDRVFIGVSSTERLSLDDSFSSVVTRFDGEKSG